MFVFAERIQSNLTIVPHFFLWRYRDKLKKFKIIEKPLLFCPFHKIVLKFLNTNTGKLSVKPIGRNISLCVQISLDSKNVGH